MKWTLNVCPLIDLFLLGNVLALKVMVIDAEMSLNKNWHTGHNDLIKICNVLIVTS